MSRFSAIFVVKGLILGERKAFDFGREESLSLAIMIGFFHMMPPMRWVETYFTYTFLVAPFG